jgi:hypothetical protein
MPDVARFPSPFPASHPVRRLGTYEAGSQAVDPSCSQVVPQATYRPRVPCRRFDCIHLLRRRRLPAAALVSQVAIATGWRRALPLPTSPAIIQHPATHATLHSLAIDQVTGITRYRTRIFRFFFFR